MKCYKCKAELPAESKVCHKCGADQGFSEALIKKAIEGDQESITELYNRTYNNVYFTVKSMVRDEDTVMDIVQDSYIKAMKSLNQLEDPNKFRAWIKRIAHNRTVDYLRKAKPVMFSQLSTEDDEAVEFEDERMESMPEASMDQKETARILQLIMDSLSDEQRAVAGMYYYEQLSVKEIAGILGISENTVKSRLSYARKKICDGVLKVEKEQGIKLHSLAPIPFLLWLFRSQEAQAAELPNQGVLKALEKACAGSFGEGAQIGSAVGKEAVKTIAKGAGKGFAAKIIAGVAAVAVIGGGIGGVIAHNSQKEESRPSVAETAETPQKETEETAAELQVSVENFGGFYTSKDTTLGITITPMDETTAWVVVTNLAPNGANAFNIDGTAVLDGNRLTMDLQTEEGDVITFDLDNGTLLTEAPEHFEARANTYISGEYTRSEDNSGSSSDDVRTDSGEDYRGIYSNGQDWNAGTLVIKKNEMGDLVVRLEAARNQGEGLSVIFEGNGYVVDNGLAVDVSGGQVRLTKGTFGLFLDADASLKQSWNLDAHIYEAEYGSNNPEDMYTTNGESGIDITQYDGCAYYENDHIKYRLDTADGNLVLTMWAMSGEPVYYEKKFYMNLSTARVSADAYSIYDITDEYGNVPLYLDNIQFFFYEDFVMMEVWSNESKMAGGASDNIFSGMYPLQK